MNETGQMVNIWTWFINKHEQVAFIWLQVRVSDFEHDKTLWKIVQEVYDTNTKKHEAQC